MKFTESQLRKAIREEIQEARSADTEGELLDELYAVKSQVEDVLSSLQLLSRDAGRIGFSNIFDREAIGHTRRLNSVLEKIINNIEAELR